METEVKGQFVDFSEVYPAKKMEEEKKISKAFVEEKSLDSIYELFSSKMKHLESDVDIAITKFQTSMKDAKDLLKGIDFHRNALYEAMAQEKKKLDNLIEFRNLKRKIDDISRTPKEAPEKSQEPRDDDPSPPKKKSRRVAIVSILQQNKGRKLTSNVLAKIMGVQQNNVTALLKAMTDEGLVVREGGSSPSDPYRYFLSN